MKTATSGFINAISDGCPYHTVKFYYNGTELDITPKTFNYYGLMIGGENINIGETCASHVEFEIYNPTVTLENKEIQVKCGIEVNGSIEYVSLGYFTVTKPSIESEVYKYIAYDRMIGLERLYVSSLTNPTTVTVMNEIVTQLGYTFASTITEITLDVNKIKGYTYREMLGFISALCGANCIFNGDGAIEFKWFVQPTSDLANIGTDRLYENGLELNSDEDLTIKYIKCATGETIENTTTDENGEETTETTDVILSVGSGSFGINISNPLMTQTVLENIYNTYFNNFTFRPCKTKLLGNILLECGDIVSVNNGLNTYTVPIMSIQHSIDGGVITNIETVAQNETEQEINYTSPTVKMVDRVYNEILEANKAFINELIAKSITTEYLKANYVEISKANIDTAWIQNLFVKGNLIAQDGSFYKLTGVKIYGDIIESNTIKADSLILKNSEDGLFYKLNVNSLGEAVVSADEKYQNGLDGSVIIAESITADKIKVDELLANKIFAQDITADGTITGAKFIGCDYSIADKMSFTSNYYAFGSEVGYIKHYLSEETVDGKLIGATIEMYSDDSLILDAQYDLYLRSQQLHLKGEGIYLSGGSFVDIVGTMGVDMGCGEATLSINSLLEIVLTAPSIKFSGTVYENGTALSSKYSPIHSHNYLPLSGGTISGNLTCTGAISSSTTISATTSMSTNLVSCKKININGGDGASLLSGVINLGTGTASDGNRYYINNNATGRFNALRYTSSKAISSRRYKNNIEYKDVEYWHNALMKIKPCTFFYNNDDKTKHIGLIAEDLYELIPELVGLDDEEDAENKLTNDEPKPSAIEYANLTVPLVAEIQRLNKEIDRLENLIKGVQA